MALKNDRYTYRVTWSEEDHESVGLCAEFPSLSWLASTPEAALRGIRRVVAEVVADLTANGELEAAEAGVSLNRIASEKLGQSRNTDDSA